MIEAAKPSRLPASEREAPSAADMEAFSGDPHFMLSLARGDGGTLLVQGVSGSGRSRMLDACALEAKLVGAQVIRASANSERSDWAAARAIISA